MTPWTNTSTGPGIGSLGSLTLIDGDTFVISSTSGDIHGDQAEGLFILDTRVLSVWQVEVDGAPLDPVSSVERGPFAATIVARPHHRGGPDPELAILRHRHVGDGLREDIEVRNHSTHAIDVEIVLVFDADFASLFEVKAAENIGTVSADLVIGDETVELVAAHLPYTALSTHIVFGRRPTGIEGHRAIWGLRLSPGEHTTICAEVSVEVNGAHTPASVGCDEPIVTSAQARRLQRWKTVATRITADDSRIAPVTEQALEDLGILRVFDPVHTDRVVVAAGAPWFMALFGRDSLLTAWMALPTNHRLAAGVLQSLAEGQGRQVVAATEEQPGRILHEVRYDHRSLGLLGGANAYFGTADATPLFVMVVAEYLRFSGDTALVEELMPAVDAALAWMRDHGDPDGDGFIEYQRMTDSGLANQGWKDSWDGIRYGDGRVAAAPIALCEVQAYAYGALCARAYLAEVFGDPDTAQNYRNHAEELQRAFDDAFWVEALGCYAVGLDGDKAPIDSVTSNIGHCLWTGIVPDHRSGAVADHLSSPALFSGWGVRTLSADNPAYNPLSYHCGSVWPHDTAIAVAGLDRSGHHREASLLRSGLLDTATALGGRLPELFSGFARSDLPAPVPYPASCSPQAWAAASSLLVVRSMLGLEPDVPNGVVAVRAGLGDDAAGLRAEGIAIGGDRVTITADALDTTVSGLDPALAVEIRR
ncbi:MAG: glycogen debranching N-terminal domain-containing protein [Acidimicrobiales bacterium]